MDISRRTFVRAGGVVAAAAAIPLSGVASAQVAADPWRRATWAPLVGAAFHLWHGGTSHAVTLLEVTDLSRRVNPAGGRGRGEAFALTFSAAPLGMQGGLCRVEGPQVGAVDLGVAPVGGQGHLEAVVNRWLPA